MNKQLNSILFAVTLLIFLFSSCERDDVCTQNMTPNLIIRFYDNSFTTILKPVVDIKVISLPNYDTIYKNATLDSISIPLNVNADLSKFIIVKSGNADTLQFNYQRNEIFVSKTCGFKDNFSNLIVNILTDSNNWILQSDVLQSEIILENSAHVKILH